MIEQSKAALADLLGLDGRKPKLRDYQIEAVKAATRYAFEGHKRGLTVAATGAGKSFIVAGIALETMIERDGPILCLQPRQELVRQNYAKLVGCFGAFAPTSIYAASVGIKDPTGPIVYGLPATIANNLELFKSMRPAGVISDEAHGLSPTVRTIIEELEGVNPDLCVYGLTGTPYRMGTGYIYGITSDGVSLPPDKTIDPFYTRVTYEIDALTLIDAGHLTPAEIMPTGADAYDTSGLTVRRKNSMDEGRFDAKELREVYAGKGRLTAKIVADVVDRSEHLKKGIVFAIDIQHAREILASMPPGMARIITGQDKPKERAKTLSEFSAGVFKWIINVDLLTTGYDEPAIDHVVFMRPTESAALFQQMVGRILRLFPGKLAAYIFDYAGNIARFFGATPGPRDIFDPVILLDKPKSGEAEKINVLCPECLELNETTRRPEWIDFPLDHEGYVTALNTDENGIRPRLIDELGSFIPGHYARRCYAFHENEKGLLYRCGGRWIWKDCPTCNAKCDIAARHCESCGGEIVDPNKHLKSRSRYAPRGSWRIDRVGSYILEDRISRRGAAYKICVFDRLKGAEFWLAVNPANQMELNQRILFDSRPEGANAIAWRYNPNDNADPFPIFGGWFAAQDCPNCNGGGAIDYYTQSGPRKTWCDRCRGTGTIAKRES